MNNHTPNKPTPDLTLTDLVDAIEQHQGNSAPVTQDTIRDCARELERRHNRDQK